MLNLSGFGSGHLANGLPPRAARIIHVVIAACCSLLLIVMMGLTVTDVLGRYLFNSPLKGSTELTELMLAGVIFLGLPAATLDRDHVTVDLLTERLSRKTAAMVGHVAVLVSIAVQLVIAWRLWLTAAQVAGYGGTTATLFIPIAPIGYFAATLCALSAATMVVQIAHRATGGK